ncbi:MAG: hypothetical protein R3E39_20510 [Anaerolineae bacterium]
MSCIIIRLLLPAISIFLLFSLSARALGSTQTPYSALAGFLTGCEDLPQPCWYGIVPGKTSLETARQILTRNGYRNERPLDQITTMMDAPENSGLNSVNLVHRGSYLWLVGLYPRAGLPLRYVASALGSPEGIVSNSPHVVVSLAYGARLRVAINESTNARFSLFSSHIKYVTLTAEPVQMLPWHGFMALWRYCQLEPAYLGCA